MYIQMSDKTKLYVKKSGIGIPCIFIHGGPGEGSLNFETLGGGGLEDFMEMIYFDQRGCARSEGSNDSDYSMKRLIDDLEEIRIFLGISEWIVMTHSFGGLIAVNYVLEYPNSVHKLILLNSTLNMEDSLKNQLFYGSKLLSAVDLPTSSDSSYFESWQFIVTKLIQKDLFYKLQYKNKDNFLKLNAINNQIKNFNTSMATQAFSNRDYFINYYSITRKIKIPVLVLTGTEDYSIGPDHYKNFKFPNQSVEIIPGKHMPYLEDNLKFTSIIKNFITI